MENIDFYLSWPDDLSVKGEIEWSRPYTLDVVFTGHAPEDETAYFYAIIALWDKEWCPFYIGIVYYQSVSERHKNKDHQKRMSFLQNKYPSLTFQISLGTPHLQVGAINEKTVKEIEGLLIYSNWHEDMINKKKTEYFTSDRQLYIKNTGFNEHLFVESAYGIFYRDA